MAHTPLNINDKTKNNINMKQKIIAMLVAILAILPTFASIVTNNPTVNIDGLHYIIAGNAALYSGELMDRGPKLLAIPSHVTYEGKTYPVVGFAKLNYDPRYGEEYTPLANTTKIFLPETIVNNKGNLNWLQGYGWRLEQIEVSKKSTEFSCLDGVLYDHTGETLLLVPRARETALVFPENLKILGEGCFMSSKLESITIPDGVTTIGDYAFYWSQTTKLVIPNTVTAIGDYAFSDTSFSEFVVPNTVSSIGANTFCNNKNLKRLSFGTSLKELPELNLAGCPVLEEVAFSSATTNINASSFNTCKSLRRIVVADDNPAYSTYGGVLYDKGCKNLLYVPYGIGSFVAPSGLESIPPRAFEGRRSLGTALLSNVNSVGEYAFHESGLQEVDLSGVKSIGEYAFYESGLQKVDLSGSAKGIGQYAFSHIWNEPTLEITLSDEMTEIPPAFQHSKINGITGGKNIKSIAQFAFSESYFFSKSILDVIKNASKIGVCAFEEAIFPDNAVIELSDDMEVVENSIFEWVPYYGNNTISTLKIGPKVWRIGDRAFNFREAPDEIYCEPDVPPACWGEPFNNTIYAFSTLYVQTPEKYAETAPWNKFNNIVYHEYSGVEVVADGGEEVSVSCVGGEMRVECADGTAVTVWCADGREAYSGTGSCTVALPRGIYIVRAGSSTRKVIL